MDGTSRRLDKQFVIASGSGAGVDVTKQESSRPVGMAHDAAVSARLIPAGPELPTTAPAKSAGTIAGAGARAGASTGAVGTGAGAGTEAWLAHRFSFPVTFARVPGLTAETRPADVDAFLARHDALVASDTCADEPPDFCFVGDGARRVELPRACAGGGPAVVASHRDLVVGDDGLVVGRHGGIPVLFPHGAEGEVLDIEKHHRTLWRNFAGTIPAPAQLKDCPSSFEVAAFFKCHTQPCTVWRVAPDTAPANYRWVAAPDVNPCWGCWLLQPLRRGTARGRGM